MSIRLATGNRAAWLCLDEERSIFCMPNTHPPASGGQSTSSELAMRFQSEMWPHRTCLYRMARKLTGNHTDAEDLVQDTMVRAYANFHQFENRNARAWLTTIMRNTWINGYRRTLYRPAEVLSGTSPDDDAAHARAAASRSAETAVLADLPSGPAIRAFNELPAKGRIVVYYADIEGYSCREISDILGIPLGTVMSRLHRSRFRMRQLLSNDALSA